MVSIAMLTKRVISISTFHSCLSFQTSASLAFSIQSSTPNFLAGNNRDHRPEKDQRQWNLPERFSILAATVDASNADIPVDTVEEKLVKDMLYRIRDCNQMPDNLRSRIIDFRLDGFVLGKVDPKAAEILCSTSIKSAEGGQVFEMTSGSDAYLTLSEKVAGTTVESRTKAVGMVMEILKETGVVKGWRDELYPVSDSFYNPPIFLMERAATDLLGVLSYGVHINGIQYSDDNDDSQLPLMWMARRSRTKSKYPSMLDHIVAGGQPAGLSLMENVIKECEEEAGIPPEIARPGVNLRPAGVVSYEEAQECVVDDENVFHTISRVVLFNYDLYLPKDFVPKPVDGEVENFFLWRIDQIKESMEPDYHDPIKPNCYLVIIEYLLRTGFVSPQTKGYLDVVQELRSGDCQ